jgi:hypothetical protein
MVDKKRYSFFITAPQAEALKRLKDLEGTTEAESIRQALNEYLAKKGVLQSASARASRARRRS